MAGARRHRWTFSARAIRNQIDRAAYRTTLMYGLHPRLDVGLEYNPKAGQLAPLANLRLASETRSRPAVLVGTSSDRVGTPEGQSFYVTVSKDLRPQTRLPVAPYLGLAYGTHEGRVRAIAGVNVAFTRSLSSLLLFDGVHLHPTIGFARGPHALSLVLIRGRDAGVSYSVRF